MAVIIGGGSSVTSSLLAGGGVVSVNFGLQANIERLYSLGSFDIYDISTTKQRTFSMNVYGKKPVGTGGTNTYSVTPSSSCADANSVSITFNPSACGGSVVGFTDTFFVSSYSYSKDLTGYGQESWAFTTKPIHVPSYGGTIYMLRGLATGQLLTGTGVMTAPDMGVIIDETNSKDSSGNDIESESGSVSSGFPGIGNVDTTREIAVSTVGGSDGKDDGNKGQVSVSIPMSPVYV